MNVLYLTYDGLTDPLGQSQVLPYVVGLNKKEIRFTIISFEKPAIFNQQKNVIKNSMTKNNIDWIPLRYTKTPPFISTFYDIYKLKRTIKKEIRNDNISLLHCRSYIAALIGLWAKKKYGVPFIFDMRGFWVDERVDGKIWNINKWHYKKVYNFFKKKEKKFLQESAYTISLTESGQKEIKHWELPFQSPIKVIPCCVDEKVFNVDSNKNIEVDIGISKDDFVISYLGSIGTWYMLEEMLDFFNELLVKQNNAKFLFITKDEKSVILGKAKHKNIPLDKIVVVSANREKVSSYLKLSSFSIFFIKPVYSKKASSPTKMGEILNLGIPIICNSGVGDVDIIMNEVIPELLVTEFSSKEYIKIIDALLKSNIDTDKLKSVAIKYFSLEKGIDNYFDVYKMVANSR